MMRLSLLLQCLARLAVILFVLLAPAVTAAAPAHASADIEVESALKAKIAAENSAGYMIYFREKPDLVQVSRMNRKSRGEFLVSGLQSAAHSAQLRVRQYLDARKVRYKSFWIDNIIIVEQSDKAVLDGLMKFPEIASLKARRIVKLHEPMVRGTPDAPGAMLMAVGSNITRVKADQVWALGYTGSGVVVASIDSGVRYTHQALVNQYRGHLDNGTYNHNYNWFDPYGDHPASPADDNGHGTHTMGTAVGSDGGANQIGMAPGAAWIACRGCNSSNCTDAALLTCGQFIAAPTDLAGNNPDPLKRPHVVNNSWGDCGQTYDDWYRAVVDNWQAAGIYPVFSNGNTSNCGYAEPPACGTVGSPARYGNVTAVGSTGESDGRYATHSNLGPTDDNDTINPRGYPSIKPQVAAPGVNIRSSVPDTDSSYEGGWSGTSMSAPHVTGLIALMLEAAPCLTYAQAETIIEQTAILNTTGLPAACTGEGPGRLPNQATGWGEIDALAAVTQAAGICGPMGTLTGTVTHALTLAPIAGATLRVGTRATTTNYNGQYAFAYLPEGSYDMTVQAFGYDNGTAAGVSIADNVTTTQNFALTPKPVVAVSGTVTDGSGAGWPLYATIDIATTGFSTTAVTDPVTGQYSVDILENTEFSFAVHASGYSTGSAAVATGTDNMTRNFSLAVNSTCDAPGYRGDFSDNCDSVTAPALPVGWATADVAGSAGDWFTHAGTVHPAGGGTQSAPNLIYFNSYDADAGEATRLYRTRGIDLSSASSATLSFWMYHDGEYTNNDRLRVQVSTNGGSTWNNAAPAFARYIAGVYEWRQHTVDLGAYTGPGNTDVRVAFLGISAWGNDMHIDNILLTFGAGACSNLSGGLVAGTVYDLTTMSPLAAVWVKGGLSSAVSDSFGVYVLFSAADTHTVTAIGPAGYDNVTESVIVANGEVTGQDFYLPPSISTSSTTTTAEPTTTTTAVSTTTTTAEPSTTTTVVASTSTTTAGGGATTTTTAVSTTTTTTPDAACAVRILPRNLGWLLGKRENTRWLLAVGTKDTEFDDATGAAWDTDAIETLRTRVFFKRFMLIKARMDGAKLEKGDYEVSIGGCTGRITMVK